MQQLIKKIFTPVHAKQTPQPIQHVVCNYSNNYYGDQVCTLNKR